MAYTYKTVEVEVSADDFDEDEIVELCQDMGYTVFKNHGGADDSEIANDMQTLCELYRNKDTTLMEALRTFLQTHTGRALP